MNRRSFLGGLGASLAGSLLPAVKIWRPRTKAPEITAKAPRLIVCKPEDEEDVRAILGAMYGKQTVVDNFGIRADQVREAIKRKVEDG